MTSRISTLMAAITILVASVVRAQEPPASAPQTKPSSGVAQGIKVHGHWLLEIRNPDGSIASRHEFTNDLVQGQGTVLLAGLLGNYYADNRWEIRLWGDPDPCSTSGIQNPCSIVEPQLTISMPMAANAPTGTIELSGSATMVVNSRLFNVNTAWNANIRGTTTRASLQFSHKPISIQVQQGQIVQVKVVFSFS